MSTKLALNLESDAFNSFKTDFNVMLRKLLHMMESQEAEEGALNVKMTVKLEKSQARDYQQKEYEAMRDITTPTFTHKVGISMQFKDEKSGALGGNYEMVYDKELGAYVMIDIETGQTSLFNSYADEHEENQCEESNDPVSLPAHVSELPAPDFIDGEFVEVVEDNAEMKMFEHLKKFIGKNIRILESNDVYTARSADGNEIVLTSSDTARMFRVGKEVLNAHVGHEVICVGSMFTDNEPTRVLIKCIECDEIIFAMDNPELELGHVYESAEEDTSLDENVEEESDYGYDAPEV